MLSSTDLKKIVTEARPLIEQQLDLTEQVAGLREVVTAAGGDWSQLKALVKAQIQDERDEAGDGKRVRKILDKADYAQGYADMLGLAKMNEKNSFAEDADADLAGLEALDPDLLRMLIEGSKSGAGLALIREALATVQGHHKPAEHPAADADEQAHSSDAGSSAPINEPALTNTTADGEDGAGASVLATQSLPERNGGDNAAQGAATSLAGAEGDADRQLNTTIIRFAPKDDNRPRSSEGLPRPYGCKNVDACATTWRAEQPCTLCRAEIAIEVGGVSIPHHGEVA